MIIIFQVIINQTPGCQVTQGQVTAGLNPGSHPRKATRSTTPQPRNMDTPTIHTQIKPKRLFDKANDLGSIKIGAEGINVEFLLLNTLIINAVKVQTVIENFIKESHRGESMD